MLIIQLCLTSSSCSFFAYQLRFDTLAYVQKRMKIYKNKLKIYTPNIDELAKQGTDFATGYCISPSCGPSRAGLYTGNTIRCVRSG